MTEQKPLDIDAILERLPHRFPFLMVDRVLSVEPGKSIVALKNVSANEAHFVGHFPGHQVMPGVLIVEALAQAGGVLAWESTDQSDLRILYLVGIDNVRFRGIVRPGDQIVLKVDLPRDNPKIATLEEVWKVANWFEREVYDLFGVIFEGHSDLRRIMLPEDWVGHPLRKDYVEQEEYDGISTQRAPLVEKLLR